MKNMLLPCSVLAVAAAGLLLAANVKTDYDHSADFGRYHTYSWLSAKATDSLWQDRIVKDVDGQLTAKGWQKVDTGGDAAVAAIGHTSERQTLETFYDGFPGWGWRRFGGGMGETTTQVERTPIGTLTVDIFDGQSKKLIWRSHAMDALSGKPEKNEKKLEKDVEDMFKKFPPNEKG
jgi:hypothetical protein